MSPYEVLRLLHEGKTVICPQCEKGIVRCEGNPQTAMFFSCDNPECNFNINID